MNSFPLGERERIAKVNNGEKKHHHHDDAEEKAHKNVQEVPLHTRKNSKNDSEQCARGALENRDDHDHSHQHPVHLLQGAAGFRQSACHAGDGHDHGESQSVLKTSLAKPVSAISFGGGGHHHHEGEHEHCPHCDEHLVDNKCNTCGYEHTH